MKKALHTLFSLCVLLTMAQAQTHTITLNGIAFSPNNLTINVGETVQWSNMGGTHNVNGSLTAYPTNPAGFGNGAAAAAPWSFSHTFTVPGVYQYRCDPHASLGMTGVITVNGTATGDVIITEINYNNPGSGVDSFEFIELYNKGPLAVNLLGWQFVSGVNYTFPSYDLNPGDYVVVAYDAVKFNQAFGFTPLAWNPASFNGLNNTSENIILVDADSVFIDSVRYADNTPWPSAADGQGPSLVLCDFDADNGNAANWAAAVTGTGYSTGGIEILANPGAASGCASGPVVGFAFPSADVPESAGDVFVSVAINGGNANPTVVTVSLNPASTATAGSDFTATFPITLTFAGGVAAETQTITIPLVNDTDIEPMEMLMLDITNATNGATIGSASFSLNITDDDTPISNSLVITGVFDAQPGATGAKGVELKALQNIADLSIYGLGSASNGGGTDGVEITLPAGALAEGDCIYVAADSALFFAYFGFNPIADGNGVSINGDDAIELFENAQVIDVFGDISYPSGSTLAWNYLDGWAYRKDGTGPDGSFFNINNWTVAAGALIGGTDNTTAPIPFPVCDYSPIPPMTAELSDDDFVLLLGAGATNLDVLGNDLLPSAVTTLTIISGPAHGTATPNGVTDIVYTPTPGFCGDDSFVYQVCDLGGCDQATVSITIECPATYPLYDIADVTTVTGGAPDSLGVTCELRGIVYGIDYQGVTLQGDPIPSLQFYLNDGTGGSISVFGTEAFGYVVNEGDEVSVRGEIVNFNCLSQISDLDTIIFHSANNPLLPPAFTTFLNESFESELVKFTNMQVVDPTDWAPQTPTATGFNVEIKSIVNPNAASIIMRIDNDCEWFNMSAPTVPFHATGLGGQFVGGGGGGCVDGYQFLPRYVSDIELLNATNESILEGKISFYPNPVGDELYLKSEIIIEDLVISNALGQQVSRVQNPSNSISVAQLQAGIYLITFQAEGAVWTSKFVKD
jgi:plastocyanin